MFLKKWRRKVLLDNLFNVVFKNICICSSVFRFASYEMMQIFSKLFVDSPTSCVQYPLHLYLAMHLWMPRCSMEILFRFLWIQIGNIYTICCMMYMDDLRLFDINYIFWWFFLIICEFWLILWILTSNAIH